MYYLAFDKNWFSRHQSKLIWLLNHKLTRGLFRRILRIENEEIINRIEPNAYWFGAKKKGKQIEVKADFRTHAKYSKRLYFAFSPIWWTMHFLDWLFIDKYIPKLSFGFLTLTAYPGSISANNPIDGGVIRSVANEAWATIRTSTGNVTTPTDSQVPVYLLCGTSLWGDIGRLITLFDTSSLGTSASISSAVYSLNTASVSNSFTTNSFTFNVFTSTPASDTALANGDYLQIGTTIQCDTSIAYGSIAAANSYNDWTLNATGIGNISKTGYTKFGSREAAYDATGTEPTKEAGHIVSAGFFMSDQTGTTKDPKLVVTYTIASPHFLSLLGVGS